MAKKSFMTGYNFGHNTIGPALGRIKAMEDDDEDGNPSVDKDYIMVMDKMNSLMDFQSRRIAMHNMPGLDELLGQSFHGGPPGFILKRVTTKHTLGEVNNSTAGVIIYNVCKIGRLVKAQYIAGGGSNNASQLNTYSNLTEARKPQSGDYFVAANLICQDNSDGNIDTGVFTGGYKGLRDKTTHVNDKIYNDFEAPANDIAQTVNAKSIPFNGHTSISVCTPNAFLVEREEGAAISNFQTTYTNSDPKSRMGLCIAYEGLKAVGDATRIIITLHEYFLAAPSPDMHQISAHSVPAHHIDEILGLSFSPVNVL